MSIGSTQTEGCPIKVLVVATQYTKEHELIICYVKAVKTLSYCT